MRTLAVTLLLVAVLAASGCSSKPAASSSPMPSMPSAGSGSPSPSPSGAATGNNTNKDYTCTAMPGGAAGVGGPGVVSVAGCNFATVSTEVKYVAEDVPGSCGVAYDENGDGRSEGNAEVGSTYKKGTTFFMSCGAQDATGTGKITVQNV